MSRENIFYPKGYYTEERIVFRWTAMRSFRAERISDSEVSIVVDSLYRNEDYLKYIASKEESCKRQVIENYGPGEESVALFIENLGLVLHGLIEIIEVNGEAGDAFEITFNGLDDPQHVKLDIGPLSVNLEI